MQAQAMYLGSKVVVVKSVVVSTWMECLVNNGKASFWVKLSDLDQVVWNVA